MTRQLLVMSMILLTVGSNGARAITAIEPGASCEGSACHSDLLHQENTHPVAAQTQRCNACHVAPDPTKHEFRSKVPGGEICAECHSPILDGPHKHLPAAAGLCTACHQIHGAAHPKQLNTPLNKLCTTCHSQLLTVGLRTAHRPAAQGQCVGCHDPHSSNTNKQLKASVPDLCFKCHDQEQRDADGRLLSAIEPLFYDQSLKKHPAFARGQCLLCHDPHASDNYRLQREPYPDSRYTSFSVDKYFCLHCHGEKTFTEPRTLTATQFRNGNLNLHYRHVNRKKGRSCGSCHDHHASDRDGLIIHKASIGDRYIEISEFEKTDTGGRCGPTCHRTMAYDRLRPEDNGLMVTASIGLDATPEELRQKPVPISGKTVFEKRCIGCHGAGASGKVGPAIHGATVDEINAALNNSAMMWVLRSLGSSEIEAVAEYLSKLRPAPPVSADAEVLSDSKLLFSTVCAACHGDDAKGGLSGMAPAITGVSGTSIERAIAEVPFMHALSALSTAEIQAIAENLPGEAGLSSGPEGSAIVKDGKTLFATSCAPCHGVNANGLLGPAITGASLEMIELAIDTVPMMKALAALGSAEVQATADYLSGLGRASEGIGDGAMAANKIDGRELFASQCAACHGADAKGGLGGLAKDVNNTSVERMQFAIKNYPMMQALATLTENQIDAVVSYLQGNDSP